MEFGLKMLIPLKNPRIYPPGPVNRILGGPGGIMCALKKIILSFHFLQSNHDFSVVQPLT
jgi:hypothetical protein